MCIGENDNAKFIRRKEAAISYLNTLLQDEELSDEQALKQTVDKFNLSLYARDDYRIYKVLCIHIAQH